ncbi:hypothetical protein [Ramlibacter alkalitolerans]|jgi:hypothetical protein|uniref:Uncharacterized protein n=1 Tax=Ramlibacter alkalitolerans TaxID=2039631 RepID=A0ABS1JQF9_9BURK|nr:hypothetical protein [Ramlibacter alkalitolerans]MBL0426386.1 hypothetical protein [Ramlibacter alkalitolerans]
MPNDKSAPRSLQQQPQRDSDPQQQRAGDTDFQSRGQAQQGGQVEGEGSYSASRDYQKNIKGYLDKADVQADAEAAKPRSESEARELEQAEREGKSHSKGEH